MDDISSIIVYDPHEELKKNVIDALIRITPEGFRVRKHFISEHMLAFIASEDPIKAGVDRHLQAPEKRDRGAITYGTDDLSRRFIPA